MRKLILLAVFAAIASQLAKGVTVAQLQRILTAARASHRSDTQIARQISRLDLSERLTDATLGHLTADFASFPETAESLQLLADKSAFLMPPAKEIPATPPPDDNARESGAVPQRQSRSRRSRHGLLRDGECEMISARSASAEHRRSV